jgi:hypothetical protein
MNSRQIHMDGSGGSPVYLQRRQTEMRLPKRGKRRDGTTEGGAVFTSVNFDEALFMKAWSLSRVKTKKGMLEEVLKVYVRLHEQAGMKSLRGKLVWEGDLSGIRKERNAGPR